MIKTERRTETITREVTTEISCDLCGAQNPRTDPLNWAADTYDRDRITIERESGTVYPEGGEVRIESFDVCPRCWRERLLPWLAEHGAQPTVREVDL